MTRCTMLRPSHLLMIVIGVVGMLSGCGNIDDDGSTTQPELWPGVEEADLPLTPLATPCSYDTVTRIATIVVATTETAIVSKRTADSALLVNGVACGTATTSTVKTIDITGSTGSDTVILDYINGTFAYGTNSGAGVQIDLLGGTSDAVKIRGSVSADRVTYGADGISINTDSYVDITVAGSESSVISLGAGNDNFTAAGGNGSGTAHLTAVTVYGGEGNDSIVGSTADDTLNGGDGNDTLTGSAGDDTLNGNAGDDTFNEEAADSGSDVFNGGTGDDTVDYSSRTTAVVVTIDEGTTNDGESGEEDDVIDDIEAVIGGTGDDTLTGSDLGDTLTGGAGDDTLDGGAGDDTLNGGDGDDTLTGGDGDDTLNGDNGDDTFDEGSAANGADTLSGGSGTDVADYSSRSNPLTITINNSIGDGESSEDDNVRTTVENILGGTGDDTITGSSSNNEITGGTGDDTLDGAGGADTFLEGALTSGADTFTGGTGIDTVDYSSRAAAITVTMDGTAADDGLASENDNVGDTVENLLCPDQVCGVTGNDLDNRLEGGSAVDTLSGEAGSDEISGYGGDDILSGGSGDDLLDGGAGADTFDCGTGDGDIGLFITGDTSTTGCEL